MLSTYVESSFAVRLLELGSSGLGYLLKDRVASVDVFTDALNRVVLGETVVDPEIIARLLAHQRARTVLDRLTSRELEVLRLMAEGHSNVGIGRRLFLSPKTVESNIAMIFSKLDLPPNSDENRRVLAVLALLRHAGP
jgi:DNA-binding NarL/FixJ family response regulator